MTDHSLRFSLTIVVLFVVAMPAQARTPWTSSRVNGSPDPPKPYHVERVYPALEFREPVELMPLADTGRMMILEVTGKLYTFVDDQACDQADLAIDINPLIDNFRRAYGFAVHPDFANNRHVFMAYAGDPVARPNGARLSRFTMTMDSPPTIDPASEEILLTWTSGGHNGCAIRFDSKGLLYFSAGDGARPFPPDEYDVGQDLSDLRATICRIDVDRRDGDLPYAIPADNPFVDVPDARPEIWAFGFRNPWRFTIVPETDQLLCGDVGWELWELVHDVKRGGNYGWSIMEGPQPIRSDIELGPTPIEKPLVAYSHSVGQSVTGGHVYRGSAHPELRGAYLYGDYVTGLLWGLRHEGDRVTWNPVIGETGLPIITFAESREHEVLVVGYDGGIYELVENPAAERPSSFPRHLSETGLYSSTETLTPNAGVLSYQPISTAHEGGAESSFVVGLPGEGPIRIGRQQRQWRYPDGTVFAKTLAIDGRRVETQLLHYDGINWHPYSYKWHADQRDAVLVDRAGEKVQLEAVASNDVDSMKRSSWEILNRAQCRACHSRQNGGAVGFSFENLPAEMIDRLIEDKIIDRRAPEAWGHVTMVDPSDVDADLEARARSYLAANCAHCHRRGGGGTVPMDLAFSTAPESFNAIDVAPSQGDFGIQDARVIYPGDPYRSTLFYRMATSGTGRMPKVWNRDNDAEGLMIVHDWIAGMKQKPSDSPPSATSESLRQLSHWLQDDDPTEDRRQAAMDRIASDDPLVGALFERFLPPSQRRKRLGNDIDPAAILAMQGDPDRGRERFFEGASQQCNLCHQLEGRGRDVGPALDGIASKRSREQLLESILEPSKIIDPKYTSHMVLTTDGQSTGGLLISDDRDVLVIRSADGKDHTIVRDEIEARRVQAESIMPAGMAADMTAEELADLLAFVSSLK